EAPQTETRGIVGLQIAGPIVLGAAWLATIGVTAALTDEGAHIGYAAIPLVGPWVLMADSEGYEVPLAVSGVLQAGGLTMLILGVAIRSERPVSGQIWDDDAGRRVGVRVNTSPALSGIA